MQRFLVFALIISAAKFNYATISDSIINTLIHKTNLTTFTPDSLITYNWNSDNGYWSKNKKSTFSYSDHRIISKTSAEYNQNEWINTLKYDYLYNDFHQYKTYEYSWDVFYNEWVYFNMKHNVYEDSLLLKYETFHWYLGNYEWINDSVIKYSYNNKQQLQEKIIEKWVSSFNTWEYLFKETHKYNNADMLVESIEYFFDYDLYIWERHKKQLCSYNTYNELIEKTTQVMNSNFTGWLNYKNILYKYYDSGKIKSITIFNWNNEDYKWIEDYKWEYIYDAHFNIIEQLGYIFDYDIQFWEKHRFIKTIYHNSNTIDQEFHYTWKFNKWNNLKRINYYNDGFVDINNWPIVNISIHPNPANNYIYLNYNCDVNDIKIFDAQGKLHPIKISTQNTNQCRLNVSDLTPGIYLLRLLANNQHITKKIIVKP